MAQIFIMRKKEGLVKRVVKVGGSLLDKQGLADDILQWLSRQPTAQNILVAGGGRVVNAVRTLDRVHSLDAESAHWLCVCAMRVTTRLLVDLLKNEVTTVTTLGQLENEQSEGRLYVFDSEHFLCHDEPSCVGTMLPPNGSVTSDSIAARIGQVLDAAELVLLKSADPPQPVSLEAAAQTGYVDEFLPQLADDLTRIRCVNFRRDRWPEWLLRV